MKATLIRLSTRISAKKDLGAFPKGARDRGVALLFALMLLVIMSALGLIMVLTVSPDMMINGYYGNFRGSYYAADSGMNIAREQLLNQTVSAFNMTPCPGWGGGNAPPCDQPPLLANTGATVLNTITTNYGSFSSLQAGQAVNSWPENFAIANTANCANSYALAPGYPQITQTGTPPNPVENSVYTYRFNYNLCSIGRAQSSQQVVTTEEGSLIYTINAQTSSQQQINASFAAFGAFIDNYPPCLGPLVPGTMTGPMFTNGAWQFMTGGAYIFTDPVGQHQPDADYFFNWSCIQSPTSSYTYQGQTIRPTFQQGLNLNQAAVAMPQNSFSQEWAVLDSMGCGEGTNVCGVPTSPAPPAVQHSDLNAKLKNISGTAYPSGGAASGVYLPYSCTGGPPCANTLNGGGFYVEGNAAIVMSVGTDGGGNPTQTYSITQGGTTTNITTNIAANTTTVVSGGTTLNVAGVPEDLVTGTATPATMLYVNGTITGLKGTGQGVPAVQDGVAVTIAANGDINTTGDLIYAHEPVTENMADTLVPGALQMTQDLGLFTATGNIIMSSPYANHNVQVDGSQAAVGNNCAGNKCGFLVNGCIDTFNNVGGQIQTNIFGACLNVQNTYFDRRYTAIAGFAPPWFPSTTVAATDIQNAVTPLVTNSVQRMSWVTTPQ